MSVIASHQIQTHSPPQSQPLHKAPRHTMLRPRACNPQRLPTETRYSPNKERPDPAIPHYPRPPPPLFITIQPKFKRTDWCVAPPSTLHGFFEHDSEGLHKEESWCWAREERDTEFHVDGCVEQARDEESEEDAGVFRSYSPTLKAQD